MRYLRANNVSFSRGATPVLRDVSVTVERGRVLGLVGPSGAGKSTLLWLLAGLLQPSAGTVEYAAAGDPAAGQRKDKKNRDGVGMVFQQPSLWDHMDGASHLNLVLRGRGLAAAERGRRVNEMLAHMGLSDLRHRRPGQLSGGQQQRLALARALVIEPLWLLLDEPLAHLDGASRDEVFELLRQALAQRSAGIILATHEPADALRMCDDIAVLLDGQLVQWAPAATVYDQPVNLACARVLGAAGQLEGTADTGRLVCDGQTILEGLPPTLCGPQKMVLRPHHLEFRSDPSGPARVLRIDLTTASFQILVCINASTLLVNSKAPITVGTAGRLVLRPPDSPDPPDPTP